MIISKRDTKLEELIGALGSGTLTENQSAELSSLLATNASARRLFAEYTHFDSTLCAELQCGGKTQPAAMASSLSVWNRCGFNRFLFVMVAVASMVAVGLILWPRTPTGNEALHALDVALQKAPQQERSEVLSDFGANSMGDLAGQKGIVVFYFKGVVGRPFCRDLNQSLSRDLSSYRERGYVILGVAPNSAQELEKYKRECNLKQPLLSDPDRALSAALNFRTDERFVMVIHRDKKIEIVAVADRDAKDYSIKLLARLIKEFPATQ